MKKITNNDASTADITSQFSLEESLLQSDLLASMARADGKVLSIENSVAEMYFKQENTSKSALVQSHYNYVVQDEETDVRTSTVMSFMSELSTEDSHKLLRCLSAIAICDGELHVKEAALIKQFAEAMNIDVTGF